MSKRILVADDSAAVRRVVHTYLAERDFDVCGEAADAAMSYGVAMIPKEVHPEPAHSDKSEETQPKETLNEDSDRIRGEVFKRMFPDSPERSSE